MKDLFPKILDDQWDKLAPNIQKFHLFKYNQFEANGRLDVYHGTNLFSRFIAWILRMPAAKQNQKVVLTVRRDEMREFWVRKIGKKEFPSIQEMSSPGVLSEKVGCFDFHFNLRVESRALYYASQQLFFRWRRFSWRVPKFLSPKISAYERPGSEGEVCEIGVEISLAPFGVLLKYCGRLRQGYE